MTQRIAIGNGKFCYTGTNCKLHGTRQVENARTLMLRAVNSVSAATTFDELQAAKTKLDEANSLYDATSEGQRLLKDLMVDADALEKAALKKRLDDSVKFAEEYEANQKSVIEEAEEGLTSFELNEEHTYDIPTYSKGVSGNSFPPTVGSKYSGFQTVTEVAKKLRQDFKEAQEKGYLPTNLKFSVSGDKYAGGQSLNVIIQNTKDSDVENPVTHRHTLKGSLLTQRVKLLTDAYNSQAIYSQVDYYNAVYNSRVTVEDESSREVRIAGARTAKKQRDEKPLRDKFISAYRNDPTAALDNVRFTHVEGARQVGRLEGTSIYVFRNEIMGKTYVKAFDLSYLSLNTSNSAEALILQSGQSSQLLDRKNILKPARRTRR